MKTRIAAAVAGAGISAAALTGCWKPVLPTSEAAPYGCEVDGSRHSGGFVDAFSQCAAIGGTGRLQRVVVWCGSARAYGNLVASNGTDSASRSEIFCGDETFYMDVDII